MYVFHSWRPGMTSKADSRWRPSFEKARGRVLIEKLMAGGALSYGETTTSTDEEGDSSGFDRE